ncbi:MAG: plasmid partitioning protein RepB C-terminal domain-containing protein [Verrucomicrobiota bacterium]|jgi:ParB/RepB/Spo0J family partition protein
MSEMKIGFEMRRVRIALADILPVRHVKDPQDNIKRYRTIRASIKEVGLIEPLVVYPQKGAPGKYLLLDGHLRHYALKDLGRTEAECIIASDDESFTYNARVNRLNPIAEHKMIMKAVNNGVKPEKIAAALNLSEADVKASMTLLDGINEEAADLLKDKAVSPKAIRLMRKVSGVRQIEIAELMVSAGNYTKGYAEALVLGTPKDQLVNPDEPKQKKGMTREEIGKLEAEMETLERDLKAVERSYGDNMLNLTLARGYVKKLLDKARVVRFLNANHPDIFTEFESLAAAETL